MAENAMTIKAPTHPEFLCELLRQEVEKRDEARKARLIKQAGFHSIKTLHDFIFDEIQLPAQLTSDELANCQFIQDKRNLIFYGNVGTGKTHLATALGIQACRQGKQVRFYRTASLVNILVQAKRNGSLEKILRQLAKLDLLICDEWGYVPLDREGSQLLFNVISDCYEARSLIITTNLEFVKWVNIFYDENMTAALIDRLVHHSHLLVFSGQSYRVKRSLISRG